MALIPMCKQAQYKMASVVTLNFDDSVFDETSRANVPLNAAHAALKVKLIALPQGAIVTGGTIATTNAFSNAITVSLGNNTTPACYYAAANVATLGTRVLLATATFMDDNVVYATITPGGAQTKGRLVISVEYVVPGRANEIAQ